MMQPLGVTINNPGDLRPNQSGDPWLGQTGVQDGFCTFSDVRYGLRALGKTLLAYNAEGWNTPALIATHYAPDGDGNDSALYASDLACFLGCNLDTVLVFSDAGSLYELMDAIVHNEVGADPEGNPWYPDALIHEAAAVVLGAPFPADWPQPGAST